VGGIIQKPKSGPGFLQAQGDHGQAAADDEEAQEKESPHAGTGADVLETDLIFGLGLALIHVASGPEKMAAFRLPPCGPVKNISHEWALVKY
jgi:hypothetical protein